MVRPCVQFIRVGVLVATAAARHCADVARVGSGAALPATSGNTELTVRCAPRRPV